MSDSKHINISGDRPEIGSIVQGDVDKIDNRMGQANSLGTAESFHRLQLLLIDLARLLKSDASKIEALKDELQELKTLLEKGDPKDSDASFTRIEKIRKRFSWTGPILKLFLEKYLPPAT